MKEKAELVKVQAATLKAEFELKRNAQSQVANAKVEAEVAKHKEENALKQSSNLVAEAKAQAETMAMKQVKMVQAAEKQAQAAAFDNAAYGRDKELAAAVTTKLEEEAAAVAAEEARDAKEAEAAVVVRQAKKEAAAAAMSIAIEGDKLKSMQAMVPELRAAITKAESRTKTVVGLELLARGETTKLRAQNLKFRQQIETTKGREALLEGRNDNLAKRKAGDRSELKSLGKSITEKMREVKGLKAKLKVLLASNGNIRNKAAAMAGKGQVAGTLSQQRATAKALKSKLTKVQLEKKEAKAATKLKKLKGKAVAQQKAAGEAEAKAASPKRK